MLPKLLVMMLNSPNCTKSLSNVRVTASHLFVSIELMNGTPCSLRPFAKHYLALFVASTDSLKVFGHVRSVGTGVNTCRVSRYGEDPCPMPLPKVFTVRMLYICHYCEAEEK